MKIHAIRTGSVRVRTAQLEARRSELLAKIDILTDPNWSDWLPTFAWAIEHDDGVTVVDTGQATHLLREASHSLHPYMRRAAAFQIEPEEEIGPQLRALGIGPRDVTQVVLTHMHVDHDGGLAHFPNSRILAAPGEIAKAKGVMGVIRGYLPQRWPSWFEPEGINLDHGPYAGFAASKRLTQSGDVVAVATPGHTADHLSILVEDGDVTVMLAGDTSYTQTLMLAGKVDGITDDAATSAATLATIQRFASERPTVYLPTHDPETGARFAARQVVPQSPQLQGVA